MTTTDIAVDYDRLVTDLDECKEALAVVWSWLNKNIDPENKLAVWSFFQEHGGQVAIFNLALEKIDKLTADHKTIVAKAYKESED